MKKIDEDVKRKEDMSERSGSHVFVEIICLVQTD